MINDCKSTEKQIPIQIAGMSPNDIGVEFIAAENETTLWMQHGCVHYWSDLPKWRYKKCEQNYLADKSAVFDLSKRNLSLNRQVEIFIHHKYGDVDVTPDMIGEELQPSENYRATQNCSSLNWDTKWITMDGIALTNRDLRIIDLIIEGLPDKAIASELGITTSTFDFHKRNLFKKAGVQCKTDLIVKALKQHIS